MQPPCATWLEKDLAFSLEPEKKVVAQTSAVTRGAAYFGLCSVKGMRGLTHSGRDTNPSQVSSQQTLVLIYLPRKDKMLCQL